MDGDELNRLARLAQLRGKHYVVFKSGAVQRWAARNVGAHKDYASLNSTLWRKAGLDAYPEGGNHDGMPGSTYYFDDPADAIKATVVFMTRMRELRVI